MPLAGSRDSDRARAHLRWAERYSRNDDPNKAAAHFGRALEYDRRSRGSAAKSQKFGAFEVDGHQVGLAVDPRLMAAAGTVAASAMMPVIEPYVTKATNLERRALLGR